VAQPVGIVHVLVTGEPAENRLPQHADQGMTAILPSTSVGKSFAGKIAQAEYIIEFAIGEQTCIGGDDGSRKLNHNATVEIEVQNLVLRFTRRVRRFLPVKIVAHTLIIRQIASK
jgi:hypothetical protein